MQNERLNILETLHHLIPRTSLTKLTTAFYQRFSYVLCWVTNYCNNKAHLTWLPQPSN